MYTMSDKEYKKSREITYSYFFFVSQKKVWLMKLQPVSKIMLLETKNLYPRIHRIDVYEFEYEYHYISNDYR